MWDNPHQLNQLSRGLRALLVLLWFYIVFVLVQQSEWLPVKAVKIEGNLHYLTSEQLALVVDHSFEGNFFAVDLARVHRAFESLPWVEHVRVKRDWKSRMVVVSLTEHQPLASWGDSALMSNKGKLFNAVIKKPLPVLFGPENTEKSVYQYYQKLGSLLKSADLSIAQLTLSAHFAWRLTTTNGMTIEIGSTQDVMQNVRRFVDVYRKTVGEWHGKLEYVDLRYKDGFAIRRPMDV